MISDFVVDVLCTICELCELVKQNGEINIFGNGKYGLV